MKKISPFLLVILVFGLAAGLKYANFWALIQPDSAHCGNDVCYNLGHAGNPLTCETRPCPALMEATCFNEGSGLTGKFVNVVNPYICYPGGGCYWDQVCGNGCAGHWGEDPVMTAKVETQYNDLCNLGCKDVDLTHWDKPAARSGFPTIQIKNNQDFGMGYECAEGPCAVKKCLPVVEDFNSGVCSCETNRNNTTIVVAVALILGFLTVVYLAKRKK